MASLALNRSFGQPPNDEAMEEHDHCHQRQDGEHGGSRLQAVVWEDAAG